MLLKMFSVFDAKADAFLPPFFLHNNGLALRTFGDACNMKDHQFGKHPEDYTLFELGAFEDGSGTLKYTKRLSRLGLALSLLFVKSKARLCLRLSLKPLKEENRNGKDDS